MLVMANGMRMVASSLPLVSAPGRWMAIQAAGVVPSEDSPSIFRPVIIAGPSGVGKSTLIRRLTEKYPGSFGFAVSHTTRTARPGEVAGQHYHFVNRDEFQQKQRVNGFVEHAEFAGNLYGTSKEALKMLESQGRIPLLDIDIQGVRQIRKVPSLFPACLFLTPPSIEELERRLSARGDTNPEAVQKRLAAAKQEIDGAQSPGLFDIILISGDREAIWKEFEAAVLAFNRSFPYQ